ncbi:MAG: cytidine deaminase [Armatimonadota bacterium]
MRRKSAKSDEWERLVAAAREVSRNAHAPYSRLRIGAAIEAADGTIYSGCNVENSSFGLTVCAERVALQCAVAAGARSFTRLAIYTSDAGPLSPCGACRQALVEFSPDLAIRSVGRGGLQRDFELAKLLPRAFGWPFDCAQGGPAGEASNQPEG